MGGRLGWAAVSVVLAAAYAWPADVQEPRTDPFEFVAPWVVVSEGDRRRLDRGEVVARTLKGREGQLAVFAATRLSAPPDALIVWTRAIADLKRSAFVLAIGRFSDPPVLSDLDGLTLDERDLAAIEECVPGDCGLKLSAAEIESLASVVAAAGSEWQAAAQREFRRLIIERIRLYKSDGLGAIPPPADREKTRRIVDSLSAIVTQSPYLAHLPTIADWLRDYPRTRAGVESFFYWSKEYYGEGKPVINVTHVGIVRPESNHRLPAVLVAGKQIFATHYVEGGLGLTMVLRDTETGGAYLVYLNRTELDALKGLFGGFARGILEGRVRGQAPDIVRGLRARLESGPPPGGQAEPAADVGGP